MAELLSPGVVMQEVPFGPQPIEGVSTSTAGFVGEALYGPTKGAPVLVTSFADFERKFGGLVPGKHLGYAIRGYFENGGRRAYVMRVVGDGASPGNGDIERTSGGTLVPIVGALVRTVATTPFRYRFALTNVVGLSHEAAIKLIDRQAGVPVDLTVKAIDPATGVVEATSLDGTLEGRHGDRYYVQVATGPGSDALLLDVTARHAGTFSGRMSLSVMPRYSANVAIVAQISTSPHIYQMKDVSALRVGDRIELRKGTSSALARVVAVNSGLRQITTSLDDVPTPRPNFAGGQAYVITWRFQTAFDGQVVETLDVSSDPALVVAELAARSAWLSAAGVPALDPEAAAGYPTMPLALAQSFEAGADGALTGAAREMAFVGSSVTRTGLAALELQDGINVIAAPGESSSVVVHALISQAERLQDRFAVVDADPAKQDTSELLTDRGQYNSSYAAVYHPWLRARDPITSTTIDVPPSGHVAGCFARTDNDRGVFKAPANVVLRGITGLKIDVTTGEQDILNPAGINVLRRFDQLGYVIWGARTMSSDTLWKYVPVRRLFIFLEQSIARGTRYAVFEPNAQPLWMRIRDSVTNFLTTQWRSGALFGESPEQAFFVKVDETTTTQDDRDLGRVNILVGIAPVKPAEFVVFQIGQAPSSVIIAEAS